jgi:hypothetical protein
MRFTSRLIALGTTLALGSAHALAAQGSVKLEVSSPDGQTVWYTDPFWLGLGGVVILIVIVLAILASKNSSRKTTTTVVR